ncbi:Tat pathway signal sequence domain protein [Brevibacillus nitrificans]|uniref:Tat pathway signal sequence domain protein n=1 Tax=Brevibacillus nitrificans TaxID=651560 RepID=A0A3M8DCN6_9BACL|nr:Tat pathway signal sequence domain protein [Brevibacillus nitrificans]RNB85361.1 Tat pathway signal sequence domain protein [Brevibacillus nitrificans]
MKRWVSKWVTGLAVISLLTTAAPMAYAEKSPLKSKMFDLSAPAEQLIRDKELHNGTVMQSFAIDDVHQRIYVLQLMAGGQQLPGESGPVTGAQRDKNGDMTLTQLDLEGNKLGYMFLKGFGHGVQMGVETNGDTTYLWTETDSVTEGSSGWGTQLARFPFENGKILTPDSEELQKHQLIEGVDRTTVNIDQANDLLTMRYRQDGAFRFGVFELDKVLRQEYEPIADVAQPSMGTFQGFASYGGYLYLLEGNSYGSSGSVEPTGNTYVTVVNLNTGKVVDKQLIPAGTDLSFREPEGLAVRIPDAKHPQKAELGIGFASSFTPLRLANVFTFDRLLPEQAIVNKNSKD